MRPSDMAHCHQDTEKLPSHWPAAGLAASTSCRCRFSPTRRIDFAPATARRRGRIRRNADSQLSRAGPLGQTPREEWRCAGPFRRSGFGGLATALGSRSANARWRPAACRRDAMTTVFSTSAAVTCACAREKKSEQNAGSMFGPCSIHAGPS